MLNKGAESLPQKAAHDYKALAKLYDSKNYKKGLKNAEKILLNHPNHPETLAMKALFELGLDEEDKAQITAKEALMKSKMQSMFCWHTYGSVLKHKKNYHEAVKCFQQAVNFQKDNVQILRETAALQIQVRDHTNHMATRWKILQLKPNMLYNWVAFALACHLKGNFDELYKALTSIENIRSSAQMKPVELSHYFLYRAIAYQDGELFQKMHKELQKHKEAILDKDIWHELNFKACLKLNKTEQAKASMVFLLKKYPENDQYIAQYSQLLQLPAQELYTSLITQFDSKMAKLHLLSILQDRQEFSRQFSKFIKPYYQKSLISLFAEIQIIYEKSQHIETIERIFLEMEESLRENRYPDGSPALFPTEYLWSLYMLAQHYSRQFETLQRAHQYICKAIAHTNTVSEFYILKAEIEYKMHNNLQALLTINEARKTDLADRYMNNICVKYLMKCMKPTIAEEVLRLFMRDENSLYELQNQWYIIEAAKSFLKQRKFEPGLRHINIIEKQFIDISANQYDFHTYCTRKWTLREYIELIAFNDNLYIDKKYMEAAGWALEYFPEYCESLKGQKEEEEKPEITKKTTKKKKKNKEKEKEGEEMSPLEAFHKKVDYFGTAYADKIKSNPMAETLTIAKNVASAKSGNKHSQKDNKIFAKAYSQAIGTFIRFNKPLLAIRVHKKLLRTGVADLVHLWTVRLIRYCTFRNMLVNEIVNTGGSDEIIQSNCKEYLSEIGISPQQYHQSQLQILPKSVVSDIKEGEVELTLEGRDTRTDRIKYYLMVLEEIIKTGKKDGQTLQRAFYVTHRLEFYGSFTDELRNSLNAQFGDSTTYYTDWHTEVQKLPHSTWGLFWLSEYDLKREEQAFKAAEQKQKDLAKKSKKAN